VSQHSLAVGSAPQRGDPATIPTFFARGKGAPGAELVHGTGGPALHPALMLDHARARVPLSGAQVFVAKSSADA